jgi:superfamily I DNA and/or RNA helicase
VGKDRRGDFPDVVFDCVIVDEAAQAIEAATLIPLYAMEPTKVQLEDTNQLHAMLYHMSSLVVTLVHMRGSL